MKMSTNYCMPVKPNQYTATITNSVSEAVASLPAEPTNKEYLKYAQDLRTSVPVENTSVTPAQTPVETVPTSASVDTTSTTEVKPTKTDPGLINRIMNRIRGI
jgi:hypothetical protein